MKWSGLLAATAACILSIVPAVARPPILPANDIDREPNDTFADAVSVQPPLSHSSGCIAPATDVDFYRFSLADKSPLFIGARAKGGAQFNLAVFDGKRQKVASGTDSIDLNSADAGTYFLRISGMEKDCYDLQIFAESRIPPFG